MSLVPARAGPGLIVGRSSDAELPQDEAAHAQRHQREGDGHVERLHERRRVDPDRRTSDGESRLNRTGAPGVSGRRSGAGARRHSQERLPGGQHSRPPRWRLARTTGQARRHAEERLQSRRSRAGARRHPRERLPNGRAQGRERDAIPRSGCPTGGRRGASETPSPGATARRPTLPPATMASRAHRGAGETPYRGAAAIEAIKGGSETPPRERLRGQRGQRGCAVRGAARSGGQRGCAVRGGSAAVPIRESGRDPPGV